MSLKDFETFSLGALLVKPDMSHLSTFPDFYKAGDTYISVDWRLDNLREGIQEVLAHYEDYLGIAAEGQRILRYYSEEISGRHEFVEHVVQILQ